MFEILRSLFGWIDGLSKKRRISELETESFNEYTSPTKKRCCDHFDTMNGRDVIEIEDDDDDDDDDIQIYEDKIFNSQSNYNHKPSSSTESSKNSIRNHKTLKSLRHPFDHSSIQSSQFYGKYLLNSKNNFSKHSTLSKTYQLQEKEQYGKLLRSFLPQRIYELPPKLNNRRAQKPVEVIDVETDPSVSSIKDPEVFSTPKLVTPSRYFTPMGKLWSKPSTRRQSSIEEIIKIDRNDFSAETSNTSFSLKNKTKTIPHVIITQPKEVTTNTLRDKLSAKTVLNKDYIPRISGQYNERIKQKCQEAEELKKTTHVLAKRNRMAREISLEQHLSKSMKLYEEILPEDEFVEEQELPQLTDSMVAEIKNALNPRPPDQILVESFGLRITRKDIYTLAGLNWLNDEVINFYMNLLIARGETEKYPPVYAMNTFFYPKLLSGGHSSLKRWTRKVDIFAKDIIVIPIHLGMHWCMSIIDFRDKSIRYYDSMGGQNSKCLYTLKKYLEDESLDKKKKSYDTSDWTLESMNDIPQQMNGSDCGVFSCTFAEFICANRKLTFSQDNMPYFRSKMVYEILNVKLL